MDLFYVLKFNRIIEMYNLMKYDIVLFFLNLFIFFMLDINNLVLVVVEELEVFIDVFLSVYIIFLFGVFIMDSNFWIFYKDGCIIDMVCDLLVFVWSFKIVLFIFDIDYEMILGRDGLV